MPKIKSTQLTWATHKQQWKTCELCQHCVGRSRVVLGRGRLPAEVLFIGEAPGASEDTLGRPFVGPAGQLLDSIIDAAVHNAGLEKPPSMAFTNLLGCIPRKDGVISSPKAAEIQLCAPRLQQFAELTKPRAVVTLGKLSATWAPKILDLDPDFSVDLIHPSALLRCSPITQPLEIQRATIRLQDLFEDMYS